jgi:hypothetical protein
MGIDSHAAYRVFDGPGSRRVIAMIVLMPGAAGAVARMGAVAHGSIPCCSFIIESDAKPSHNGKVNTPFANEERLS